ncbi:hypothetical protein GOV04_00800 [Candidatus Woesearchaeota archaeon]|nr:hypothetical protein [Candidatus Woesearchaeota archaeon]
MRLHNAIGTVVASYDETNLVYDDGLTGEINFIKDWHGNIYEVHSVFKGEKLNVSFVGEWRHEGLERKVGDKWLTPEKHRDIIDTIKRE